MGGSASTLCKLVLPPLYEKTVHIPSPPLLVALRKLAPDFTRDQRGDGPLTGKSVDHAVKMREVQTYCKTPSVAKR